MMNRSQFARETRRQAGANVFSAPFDTAVVQTVPPPQIEPSPSQTGPPTVMMPLSSPLGVSCDAPRLSPTTPPFQLEDMTTTDLLNNINPELLHYVKQNSPFVYSGLLAQERANGAPGLPASAANFSGLLPLDATQAHSLGAPFVSLPQLSSQFSSTSANSLSVADSRHSLTPPVSVSSILTTPEPSSSAPILTQPNPLRSAVAAAAAAAAAAPATVSVSMGRPASSTPASSAPYDPASNPALMAVLRQAQAVAAVSQPLQHLNVSRALYTPTSNVRSTGSPAQSARGDAAAVAAVAGAAAAAAAAADSVVAAANPAVPSAVLGQYSPFQVEGKRVPAGVHMMAAGAGIEDTMSQAAGHARVGGTGVTATRAQGAKLQRARMAGQKGTGSIVKQSAAVAAAGTVGNSSLLGKRASSTSSTTSRYVAQVAAPANQTRLHPTVGAGTAGGASKAATLKREATEEVGRQVTALMNQASDAEEDANQEVKKAMRAERNRQSAAASRERKKQYIKELERRVNMLSQENAKMQVCQFRLVRERLDLESKILGQVKELKRKLVDRDLEINKLSKQLESAKLRSAEAGEDEETEIPRPSTWDASEWRSRRSGRGRWKG